MDNQSSTPWPKGYTDEDYRAHLEEFSTHLNRRITRLRGSLRYLSKKHPELHGAIQEMLRLDSSESRAFWKGRRG